MNESPKDRILVVEDDPQMSKFVQFKLNYLGYEVVGEASRCEDAVQRSELLHPDLILMDIMLEGEADGIETSRRIRETQDIPIVFLTAHEDPALFERAKITEPFGYLIKPFNDRDLRIVLETSLYRHRQDKRMRQALRSVCGLLDSTVDAMISYDTTGKILEFNQAAAELFDLDRRKLTELNIRSICPSGDAFSILTSAVFETIARYETFKLLGSDGEQVTGPVVITPVAGGSEQNSHRLLVFRR